MSYIIDNIGILNMYFHGSIQCVKKQNETGKMADSNGRAVTEKIMTTLYFDVSYHNF